MWAVSVLWMLCADPSVLQGRIKVTGGTPVGPVVELHVGGQVKTLEGPLGAQLKHVADATVEVVGVVSEGGKGFVVQHFRLLDVGCGMKPLVGQLVVKGAQLLLQDGEGEPLVLQAGPKVRMNIVERVGKTGRLWVCGPALLSGAVQVKRFGVLESKKNDG